MVRTAESFETADAFETDASGLRARAGAHIVVVESADRTAIGRVIDMSPGGLEVGRAGQTAGEALVQIHDTKISRSHFRIRYGRQGWLLSDPGSRNGTFVGGRPAPPKFDVLLGDVAVIRAGESIFVFRVGPGSHDGWNDPRLPGVAPGMRIARRKVLDVAAIDAPVLILGETGTGKEYAARAIHAAAFGDDAPFVPVNCAELTAQLGRAELFGVADGAFTDAKAAPGLVGAADKGTLFLDEIGELPADVQAELLRFTEDRTYRRVGSTELQQSTARVVAATNVDLDAAVDDQRFRRDLLSRLRSVVSPIVLPPLSDRPDDVLAWASRFQRADAERVGAQPKPWTAGFAESVLLKPSQDNLRGLRMIVGSAMLQARDDDVMTPEHLPESFRARRAALRETEPKIMPSDVRPDPSREAVIEALRATKGVAKKAAESLGIERTKLYRLLKQHGINLVDYRAS